MKGPTLIGPNLHGPLHDRPALDFDGDGKVSRSELALALVLGGGAFVGALFLGAVLVLGFCG